MKLADWIEFDRQLHSRTGSGAESLRRVLERDRKIGRTLGAGEGGAAGDEALLAGWAAGIPEGERSRVGEWVAAGMRWTAVLLALAGLLAGAGTAAGLLRYDGTEPINVLFFLGVIVGGQLLLLPLLVAGFLFRRHLRGGWGLARGVVGGLLMRIAVWLARLDGSGGRASRVRAEIGDLRARQSLFARVQPVLVVALMQIFGVAFNLAVVATLLFLVVFSDLTFSWGTTIQVEPERVHRITTALSAPWAGFLPEARPTLELVENTRFARLEGAFVRAGPDAALRAGGWWPFLTAATVAYGLLPRLLALGAGLWLLRREMRRALAESVEVQALKERLRTPLVTVDADRTPEPVRKKERSGADRSGPPAPKELELAAVFWAYDEEPPEAAVERLLGVKLAATVRARLSAGGVNTADEAVLERIRQAKERGEIRGAAVFFEPFEPPKTDARRFLERLREVLGESGPVVVVLAEFAGEALLPVEERDWETWSDAVRSAGDPFLLMLERKEEGDERENA